MKKLLTILCLVLLSSYSYSEEISLDQPVERDGVYYEVNSATPFTGSVEDFDDNGRLKGRITVKDGQSDGSVKTYYDNSDIKTSGNFKDGKQDGLYEEYYSLDSTKNFTNLYNWAQGMSSIIRFNAINRFVNVDTEPLDIGDFPEEGPGCPFCGEYVNSPLKTIINFKDGIPHGLIENYYVNGFLERKGNFIDGQQDGFWSFYYFNGQLSRIGKFKNGLEIGVWEFFDENGQMRFKGRWNHNEGVTEF